MKNLKFIFGGKKGDFDFILKSGVSIKEYDENFNFFMDCEDLKYINRDSAKYMIFYTVKQNYVGYIYIPYQEFYSKKNILLIVNKDKRGILNVMSISKRKLYQKNIIYRNSFRNIDYLKYYFGDEET